MLLKSHLPTAPDAPSPATRKWLLLLRPFAAALTGLSCGAALTGPAGGNALRCVVGANAAAQDEVSDAIAAADAVYKAPEFWEIVSKRVWLASPTGPPLPGSSVADVLSKVEPTQRGYAITHLKWSNVPFIKGRTVAQTAPCGNVTIDVKHIGSLEMLVNTVAHENSHVPGLGGGPIGCEPESAVSHFTDGDYDDATKVWLVSYGTGDLAECFYLAKLETRRWTFDSCVAHIVDGALSPGFDRRHEECCACGKTCAEDDLLKRVRAEAGPAWCSGQACGACGHCN